MQTTAGTGTGGGATLATTFEAGGAAGDGATFPKCCFKKKTAPNTTNASSNSAKTNFGLIILFQNDDSINSKSKTSNPALHDVAGDSGCESALNAGKLEKNEPACAGCGHKLKKPVRHGKPASNRL